MSQKRATEGPFTPAPPRLAATVLICQPLAQPRDGFDYEILFVKRKESARFMPGYHVFPGGITEKTDEIEEGHPLLPQPLPDELKNPLTRTLRLAATREVFEESNVLLCDRVVPPEDLARWRPEVLQDVAKFVEMCVELGCKPSWQSLYEWAHWITPEDEKYRYDTYFYLIPIEKERQLHAAHDEMETTRHDWLTPAEVMHSYDNRKIQLAPPTWIITAELCAYPKMQDLVRVAQQGRDLTPTMPKFHMQETSEGMEIHLCLPGDKQSATPLRPDLLRRMVIKPGHSYQFLSSLPEATPWESVAELSAKL